MSSRTIHQAFYLLYSCAALVLIFSLLLCLQACYPQEKIEKTEKVVQPSPGSPLQEARYPRILGAQVTLFESQDDESFARSLDQMRAAGVNTLFFRVFQNPGDRGHGFIHGKVKTGVYFETSKAPVVEDVLGRVCAMAHDRGMRVFAWMTTRRCGWLLRERPDLAGWTWDPKTGHMVRSKDLDLFHPEVAAYLQDLFSDLARYPIDGILFQDDLVLRHTEGFGPEAGRLYLHEFGRELNPLNLFELREGRISYRPEFRAWAAWKNRRILEVIDSLADRVAEVRPGLYWALNGYYESVTDPKHGLAWYAQDLKAASSHRIDYIAVMAYHRQIMDELHISYDAALALITALTRDAMAMAGGPDRVLIKVQTLDWHTEEPLPDHEIAQVFDAVLGQGRPGLVYVRGKAPPPLGPVRDAFFQ